MPEAKDALWTRGPAELSEVKICQTASRTNITMFWTDFCFKELQLCIKNKTTAMHPSYSTCCHLNSRTIQSIFGVRLLLVLLLLLHDISIEIHTITFLNCFSLLIRICLVDVLSLETVGIAPSWPRWYRDIPHPEFMCLVTSWSTSCPVNWPCPPSEVWKEKKPNPPGSAPTNKKTAGLNLSEVLCFPTGPLSA